MNTAGQAKRQPRATAVSRRKKRTRKAKRANRSKPVDRLWPQTWPRSDSAAMNPVPEELDTTLWWYTGASVYNVGVAECNTRYRTNTYAPDSTTLANRMNGFTQLIALYKEYRVISYEVHADIENREAFSQTILLRNTNTDPGVGTGQFAYMGEQYSKFKTLGPSLSGNNIARFRYRYNICDVVGRNIEEDDLYVGIGAADPSDLCWLGISGRSVGGEVQTSTKGIGVTLLIKFRIRFFARQEFNDTIAVPRFSIVSSKNGQSGYTVESSV